MGCACGSFIKICLGSESEILDTISAKVSDGTCTLLDFRNFLYKDRRIFNLKKSTTHKRRTNGSRSDM